MNIEKAILTLVTWFFAINSQAQWGPDVRLTYDPAVSSTSYNNARVVASLSNILHVMWYDNRDGNYEIYYKRSTDAGISWGADIRLTFAPASSSNPSVVVFGSFVHVVWHDFRNGNQYSHDLYYKRSTDAGESWGEDIRLTTEGPQWFSSVAVFGSFVHVVWQDGRGVIYDEIYHKRSTDAGVSWGEDTRLTFDPGQSSYPSVDVFG